MHLVNPLAAGVWVAGIGTAILNKRGTATRANYYKDFEASQVYTAQPIALDSSGSVVVYVNELVDVLVYASDGTLVREFVAGDSDNAVEVISPSFTGISYSDGSSGINKPVTLGSILDLWTTSAGAPDFKVIPSGTSTPVTIAVATSALASLFFNVKSYGAIGNGVADDGAAVQAAFTAASLAPNSGGTVFFPPGTYRSTIGLSFSGGSKMLGAGGAASRLMFDSASAGLTINATADLATLDSMYISCQTTGNAATLIAIGTTGRTHMQDCTFGGSNQVLGKLLTLCPGATGETTVHRCQFTSNGIGVAQFQVQALIAQAARFVDCDFINKQANAITHISATDGFSIRGCRFSADSASALATNYISYTAAGAVSQACEIIGNFFSSANAGVVPVAIANADAVPSRDVIEYGNSFGFAALVGTYGAIIPYSYATDGYASTVVQTTGFHGSRSQNRLVLGGATPLQCDPKANGSTFIANTGLAAITLQTTKGSMGDVWVLSVSNTSGGVLTVTLSAQMVSDIGATFTVNNNARRQLVFQWLPNSAGTGFWTQIAVSTTL